MTIIPHFIYIFAAVLIGLLPSGRAAAVNNPIIIYGGVGNLGRVAQPCLASIYESGDSRQTKYAKQLNEKVWSSLKSNPAIPGATNVIMQTSDLYLAMRENGFDFSGRPNQELIKEFLEDNEDRILVLAVIGTLEIQAQNMRVSSKGTLYDDHFFVGMSAVLVHASGDNKGQILSTGSALTESISTNTENFISSENKLCSNLSSLPDLAMERLIGAYSDAATRALDNLSKQKPVADGDADSVIVTGVGFGSKKIVDLFGAQPSAAGAPICQRPTPCQAGDENCEKLAALIAFGVTDSFSSRGYMAVPPLNWRSWGKNAQYVSVKNIKLTGGRQDVVDFVDVNVGHDSADRKLFANVHKFAEVVRDVKGKPWRWRLYMGWISIEWQETEYGNCTVYEDKGEISPKKKSYGPMKQKLVSGSYLDNTPPDNVRRFYYVAALQRALGGLRESLNEPK